MTGAEIHNGQVLQDVPGVVTDRVEEALNEPLLGTKLDPELIAAQLAREISSWLMDSGEVKTPMDLVNRLLQLQGQHGEKLLFTRFDLFQCFALWTKKLEGRSPV